ncbi:MAG: helix-turn-helix domain-containing protein [Candidatus Ornithomonoglobus sp.]
MGRKSKFSYEIKLQAVLDYQQGKGSVQSIAKSIGAGKTSIERWIMIYESQGADGLRETHHNRVWSEDIKLAAVSEYLSGNYSQENICRKYKISSASILKSWIKVYNDSHKELKSTGNRRNKPMTKGRTVSFDEKVEIVKYCIAHNKDYYDTMNKYKVSYQQIYSWVRKYEDKGVDGLVDRRGKAKPENELTDEDRLKAKNKMLEAEIDRLKMENAILKKLQEIGRRRR